MKQSNLQPPARIHQLQSEVYDFRRRTLLYHDPSATVFISLAENVSVEERTERTSIGLVEVMKG